MLARLGISVTALTIVLVLAPPRARGEAERSAQLVYLRAPGAESCPDEAALRDAVSLRLGYDPFRVDAAATVAVTLEPDQKGLAARIEVRDAAGQPKGSRRITSATTDCTELSAALALAISLAIDPLHGTRPAKLAEPAPPPPEPPPPPPPQEPRAPRAAPQPDRTPPRPVEKAGEPPRLHVAGGVLLGFGVGPAPGAGFVLGAGVRWRAFSIAAEGRADLATSEETPAGTVRASTLRGSLVPCGHVGFAAACAIASLGAVEGEGADVDQPHRDTSVFAAFGGRGAVAVPLVGALSLRLHGDLLGVPTRTTLRVGGGDVWTTPALQAAVGIGLAVEIR